jgi:uncharacterized small protein (DUF1192 family)
MRNTMQRNPYPDEHLLFSRDEYVAAHSLIMSRGEAERFVDEVFFDTPAEAAGFPSHLGEDTLDLLSLVSDGCAERVRRITGDGEEAARLRREAFRRRLGI